MNHFVRPKTKIIIFVLFLILITAIISSFLTYHFASPEVAGETVEETASEKTENDTLTKDAEAFHEMVEKVKQEASLLNTEQTEITATTETIGESLKNILNSEYSGLLTNDTFLGDTFSVRITEYPLTGNQVLRKVSYTVKAFDSYYGVPRDENRFFLQFCGESEFFSKIEYENLMEDFYVFENSDGCFAFSLYDYTVYTTFNTDETIKAYKADIYIPRNDSFVIENQVDLPVKLISSDQLSLVQEGDLIKSLLSSDQMKDERKDQNTAACIFNSETISFEPLQSEIETYPIDYDMPGLLLGLSDSQGNIRTLWIHKEDGQIKADEYRDQILFSRKDQLFAMKYYFLEKELLDDDSELRIGDLNVKKLLCAPIGLDMTDDFHKIFDTDELSDYYESLDIPLYIGENYVCYVQNSAKSGGGTFHMTPSQIRFDKLEDLPNFTYVDDGWLYSSMVPKFKEQNLAQFIYGNKAENLFQLNFSSYGGETNSYVDFTQLSLKRNLGKWSLMLPVMGEYHHPGNGSSGNWINSFAAYSNDVPDSLTTKEEKIELGGWSNWSAKDFFQFPESNACLFQFDYFIGICSQEYDPQKFEIYDIYIPVDIDEIIVSISFSDAVTDGTWMEELNKIN